MSKTARVFRSAVTTAILTIGIFGLAAQSASAVMSDSRATVAATYRTACSYCGTGL